MRIIFPNGVTVEINGVEEIAAAMPAVAALANQVPSPVTTLFPMPETITVHRTEPIAPQPEVAEPSPVTINRVRPKSMYVTDVEAAVMRVVRQFPEGITAQEVADLLDRDFSQVMSALWRIRTQRPFRDSPDALLVKISNNRVRATPMGAKIKILTSQRPNYVNPDLGWLP